ncbi:MAG: hypothetical protein WBB28_25795 [Crinalium sp.]
MVKSRKVRSHILLCLEGDKLGSVIICISYQLTRHHRSFLKNFTRLHLVAQIFYLRLRAGSN